MPTPCATLFWIWSPTALHQTAWVSMFRTIGNPLLSPALDLDASRCRRRTNATAVRPLFCRAALLLAAPPADCPF
eukprot:2587877-Pyramimonas_sp.AAC.1